MAGKVWLVGAGPGDTGLFTLRGKQVLEQADVVVYDRLIGGVGALIPETAERIYVGKASGHHSKRQEEINEILLREAQKGKRVVRLKGGDPFLFGRGGEELVLLKAHDIPFEVVPGVPSAIAVPSYNGIPVTHRDCASSVHIITAHKKADSPLPLDFAALAKIEGTLVFLMGVSALEEICARLMEEGKSPATPAAILENGTLSKQRSVIATIETLPEKAKAAKIGTPGIIVVGDVCDLAEQFHWADRRPLHGAKVVVTQSKGRRSRLTEQLQDLGAEVALMPMIETRLVDSIPGWQEEKEKLPHFSWIVFSSPSAVAHFWALLRRERIDVRTLASCAFGAVGKATANALLEKGITADYVPEIYDGDHLGDGLSQRLQEGDTVLCLCPQNEESSTLHSLLQNGVNVTALPLYETVYTPQREPVEAGSIVAFTSASSVRSFCQMAGESLTDLTAACIGEKTAAEARKHTDHVAVAAEATIDSLVETIVTIHKRRKENL